MGTVPDELDATLSAAGAEVEGADAALADAEVALRLWVESHPPLAGPEPNGAES